jgi:DNA-binding helix-hairpin-helix protein with protein kinase domain
VKVLLEKMRRTVRLAGQALGRGGEATIYPVPRLSGSGDLVAKIYHRPTREHALKVQAMIANPPADPMAGQGHVSIAWPSDRTFSVGTLSQFLGFVMPRVNHTLPVFELYNPKARLQNCPLFHFGYLLRTACNLATAVEAVHERGYVIGDLNESNVLVNSQALVSLVDTDSFQVTTPGRVWRCPVGKPEYTAPDLQGVDFAKVDRGPEHDAFALAVLLFQLLMQGIHPYAGRFTGSGEPGTLADRISQGHWPYSRKSSPYRPNPHAPPWEILPVSVQALFHRCFEDGQTKGQRRPRAADWRVTLEQAETELAPCATNAQHVYPKGLSACPWCVLARWQARDLFPSQKVVEAGRAGVRPRRQVVRRLLRRVARVSARPASPPPAPVHTPYVPVPAFVPPPRRRKPLFFDQEEWLSFLKLLAPVLVIGVMLWLLLYDRIKLVPRKAATEEGGHPIIIHTGPAGKSAQKPASSQPDGLP